MLFTPGVLDSVTPGVVLNCIPRLWSWN